MTCSTQICAKSTEHSEGGKVLSFFPHITGIEKEGGRRGQSKDFCREAERRGEEKRVSCEVMTDG